MTVWFIMALVAASALAAEKGYIDPVKCRSCHRAIFDAYQQTGMGRSFGKAGTVPATDRFVHGLSGREYSVVERSGAPHLRRMAAGASGAMEKSIDYVIGSGNHSKTFVHRDPQGRLLELPVSWYAERGGYWAMSPGYDRADHSDFRREISESCMFCHNGYPSQANGGLAMGIDCQRCHGPGEAHAEGKGTIVNPAKLSRDRQIEVCMQCHLESASRTLPEAIRRFDRTIYSYRPGEPLADYKLFFEFTDTRGGAAEPLTVNSAAYGLLKSACFQKSATLTCSSCHSPHAAARFTAVCRSCHPTSHTDATTDCAGCHMQKRRTDDAVHVVMTDHHIRRQSLKGDLLAAVAERHDRQSGQVKLLYPKRLPERPESRLYVAVAQVRASANLREDVPKLEDAIRRARPRSAEPYTVLGAALRKLGRNDDAIASFRAAIERKPDEAASYVALADLLLTAGRTDEAVALLKSATQKMPLSAPLWNGLSVAHARRQELADALMAVSKALQLDADDPSSWLNFGVCLQAKGDKKGAEAAYRQALLIQPDLEQARRYLGLLN